MAASVTTGIAELLTPLLQSLEALGFLARHLHPPDFSEVMQAVGEPDAALKSVRQLERKWPDPFDHVCQRLELASDEVLTAFARLRTAGSGADVAGLFRAFRPVARAHEALYPLAAALPALSRYFLEPALRDDAALQQRLLTEGIDGESGIIHLDNETSSRGGCSIYVPEYYTAQHAWPLVMALHGGSGHGRSFLWSWVRAARSVGAIVIAPTATGTTWALRGDDRDTPNLQRFVEYARSRWNIDPNRMLLTGMSDGGTFCYVAGLETASPFTHLAPVAAAFHPLLAEMADAKRLRGLPIYLVHGELDWMFPIEIARHARQVLSAAGARVTYQEIEDLSHTYPREINPGLLDWINAGASA